MRRWRRPDRRLVRNSDLANHPRSSSTTRCSRRRCSPAPARSCATWPRLAAICCSALAATTSWTRPFPACNKRVPGQRLRCHRGFQPHPRHPGSDGSGPDHAETCIATNPSDMNVAMAALKATVEVQGPKGKRTIPVRRLPSTAWQHPAARYEPSPGRTDSRRSRCPQSAFAANSWYLKVAGPAQLRVRAGLRCCRPRDGGRNDQVGRAWLWAESHISPGARQKRRRRSPAQRRAQKPSAGRRARPRRSKGIRAQHLQDRTGEAGIVRALDTGPKGVQA